MMENENSVVEVPEAAKNVRRSLRLQNKRAPLQTIDVNTVPKSNQPKKKRGRPKKTSSEKSTQVKKASPKKKRSAPTATQLPVPCQKKSKTGGEGESLDLDAEAESAVKLAEQDQDADPSIESEDEHTLEIGAIMKKCTLGSPADTKDTQEADNIANLVALMDQCDLNDAGCLAEYAQEKFEIAREEETIHVHDFMSVQRDITPQNREKMVDWMIEVHHSFKLEQQTLFLAINYLDRILSRVEFNRSKLQLVGSVALLISSKYEEIYGIACDDLVHISARAFTREQLLDMECEVLKVLDFDLTAHTSLEFARRFLKIAGVCPEESPSIRHHLSYVLESTLQSYEMQQFRSSLLAVCATYVVLRTPHNSGEFDDSKRQSAVPHFLTRNQAQTLSLLIAYSGYSKEEMLPCLRQLRTLLGSEPRYCFVRKKFSRPEFLAVRALDVSDVFSELGIQSICQPGARG
jgi:hypothetical protein